MMDTSGLLVALMALLVIVAPLSLAWLLIGWGVRREAARRRPEVRHPH